MPFLLLLILTLALLPEAQDRSPPPTWLGVAGCWAATWMGIICLGAVPIALSQWTKRRLTLDPTCREKLARRYSTWRLYHLFGLFGVFGLAVFALGWGSVVAELSRHGWLASVPGMDLLLVAPFFAGLILSWCFFYDVEQVLHRAEVSSPGEQFWSRAGYLGFHLRQNLALVLVPILALILIKDMPRLLDLDPTQAAYWIDGLSLSVALVVLAGMPWFMRLILRLQPLPDGPLRSRLLGAARRLHFRCNDILVWNTRHGVANAMLVGLFPHMRYVVLTDRLVMDLTHEEIEAVFGHEVGHVKHGHLPTYLLFLLLSVAVLASIWTLVETSLSEIVSRRDLLALVFGLGLILYLWLAFGFLSRRCERQADLFGCYAVSCTEPDCWAHDDVQRLGAAPGALCRTGVQTFVQALERVARLNGISRDKPGLLQSWQHSTIARRVNFLLGLPGRPESAGRFQNRLFIEKCLLFAILGLVLTSVVYLAGWDHWASIWNGARHLVF